MAEQNELTLEQKRKIRNDELAYTFQWAENFLHSKGVDTNRLYAIASDGVSKARELNAKDAADPRNANKKLLPHSPFTAEYAKAADGDTLTLTGRVMNNTCHITIPSNCQGPNGPFQKNEFTFTAEPESYLAAAWIIYDTFVAAAIEANDQKVGGLDGNFLKYFKGSNQPIIVKPKQDKVTKAYLGGEWVNFQFDCTVGKQQQTGKNGKLYDPNTQFASTDEGRELNVNNADQLLSGYALVKVHPHLFLDGNKHIVLKAKTITLLPQPQAQNSYSMADLMNAANTPSGVAPMQMPQQAPMGYPAQQAPMGYPAQQPMAQPQYQQAPMGYPAQQAPAGYPTQQPMAQPQMNYGQPQYQQASAGYPAQQPMAQPQFQQGYPAPQPVQMAQPTMAQQAPTAPAQMPPIQQGGADDFSDIINMMDASI